MMPKAILVLVILVSIAYAATIQRSCSDCAKKNMAIVNGYRRSKGRHSVAWNGKLARQAQAHAHKMFRRKSLHHSKYKGWENVAYA